MAAAAAEQRHASAGLAQDPSLLQPPDLLRTMAADGGLDEWVKFVQKSIAIGASILR